MRRVVVAAFTRAPTLPARVTQCVQKNRGKLSPLNADTSTVDLKIQLGSLCRQATETRQALVKKNLRLDFRMCYTMYGYLDNLLAIQINNRLKSVWNVLSPRLYKLHNFFDICSRGIIKSAAERFWVGQLQYKQKAQKILKFQRSQGRQKIKVFPQGTYMAQNSIPETLTILYSTTKGISKICQPQKEYDSLKSFKSIKVQSYVHWYSLILWWVKMAKMYL